MSQEQRNSTTPSDEPTTLTQRESGEASVVSSIVCNQAVHGTEVPDHIAVSVVRVGGQLLEQLRFVRNNGGTS